MWIALALAAVIAPAEIASPLPSPASTPVAARDGLVRVFFGAPPYTCDEEFLHKEITFVDFVRAREDADVHVLVTLQETASNGQEFTLAFLGQGRFTGVDDTLTFVSSADATSDDIRHGLSKTLEKGLLRYALHSSAAEHLGIEYDAPEGGGLARAKDRWNSWVFRTSLRGSYSGQKTTAEKDLFGSASATRTTDLWKASLSASNSYTESWFQLGGTPGVPATNYTSISRATGFNTSLVRALGPHWSGQAGTAISASSYYNEDLFAYGHAAIEYDVFPYADSTRRFFAFRYYLGEQYFRYHEETIYRKTEEYAAHESLDAVLEFTEPWGDASVSASASHMFMKPKAGDWFPDTSQNEIYGTASLSLKVVKGLSFDLFGSGSLLHDQFFLPRAGATDQEILLQRKQLETSYTASVSIGLSYTFGSIYSSVVNPRFSGSGASRIISF